MPAALDIPYADTRADALSFALGLAPLEALAVRTVERSGHAVELRLLGASHQVIVGAFSETVACLPGHDRLPGRFRGRIRDWSYEFRDETRVHDAAGFRRAVEGLLADLDTRDDALVGVFPGSPHAVTALAVDPADPAAPTGYGWRTWHTYPQTQEVVMTRSLLRDLR
ncbi:DUF2617 family protein [Actinomadura kijaniata]|uniref:DUF2617 family protein n=1 Tax=Actinomadura kijaniata TaxID=46161 RepID=UPI00082B2577|nr:DUF2617 family protein [Actinomadura kijaniata]